MTDNFNDSFRENMRRLQVEVLTNVGKAQTALYGLSDERRKEIISLLAKWTLLAEEKIVDKYSALSKAEKYPDIPKDSVEYVHKRAEPWEYMLNHNIDLYAEIEAEIENMWQQRVEIDKKEIAI